MCEINTSAETDDGEYDYPLSYRVAEHQGEIMCFLFLAFKQVTPT